MKNKRRDKSTGQLTAKSLERFARSIEEEPLNKISLLLKEFADMEEKPLTLHRAIERRLLREPHSNGWAALQSTKIGCEINDQLLISWLQLNEGTEQILTLASIALSTTSAPIMNAILHRYDSLTDSEELARDEVVVLLTMLVIGRSLVHCIVREDVGRHVRHWLSRFPTHQMAGSLYGHLLLYFRSEVDAQSAWLWYLEYGMQRSEWEVLCGLLEMNWRDCANENSDVWNEALRILRREVDGCPPHQLVRAMHRLHPSVELDGLMAPLSEHPYCPNCGMT